MELREAVIVDTVRTPIGKRNGALAGWHPTDLLGHTLQGLLSRTGVDPERIDDVVGGNVTQVGEQGCNVTRNAWVAAGLPQSVSATSVDRQCGSSQQAMHFAAQGVMCGAYDLVIACGVESMTRSPMASNATGGMGPFSPSFLAACDNQLMTQFEVAQILARREGITREEMDALAAESHRRAHESWESGHFAAETVPVPIRTPEGVETDAILDRDEGIRPESTVETLAALGPAAKWDPDLAPDITPGNSSQMSDGACRDARRRPGDRRGARPAGPRPVRVVRGRGRRRGAGAVGTEPRHPQAAGAHGHDRRPVRQHRVQRGLRRHRACAGPASSCPTATSAGSTAAAAPSPSAIPSERPGCAWPRPCSATSRPPAAGTAS